MLKYLFVAVCEECGFGEEACRSGSASALVPAGKTQHGRKTICRKRGKRDLSFLPKNNISQKTWWRSISLPKKRHCQTGLRKMQWWWIQWWRLIQQMPASVSTIQQHLTLYAWPSRQINCSPNHPFISVFQWMVRWVSAFQLSIVINNQQNLLLLKVPFCTTAWW